MHRGDMETYIKINKFDRYISMLKDIKENEVMAILLENIGYIHGEINLKKLENDIINKRKIRYIIPHEWDNFASAK